MKINYKLVNATLYVGLSGELDESTAAEVRMRLDSLIDKNEMKKMVVDMSELVFMDSTGIGVLIGRYKKLNTRLVPLLIASPSKAVDKILTLSGLYDIMPKLEY